jgi:hypothetical protein
LLTVEKLKAMEENYMFKYGTVEVEDYWDASKTMSVDFVAVRGRIWDWTIYYYLSGEHSEGWIRDYGDKMTNMNSIRKCVECDDESLKLYRR